MKIIYLSLILIFSSEAFAFKRAPEDYHKEEIDNDTVYLFQAMPLFREEDIVFLKDRQLLPIETYSDRVRLYLWTTPIDVTQSEIVFDANTVLPFPLYTTYPKDNLFNSPLTPLLSPLRKGIYDLGEHGFSTKIIGLVLTQYTDDNLPGTDNKTGFAGFEAYSNWILGSNELGISALTFELGYQSNIYQTEDISKSVGSIITSNVFLGDSGPIIGDIYYTQGFFNNKLLIHAGRLTPWYYYGYNTFTDSETDAFISEMFSGSVAIPSGGGNGSKPAVSLQYFFDEKLYLSSVISNTEGEDADFDFNILNEDAYFIGTELGYISKRNHLNSRVSLGLHQAKVKQKNTDRITGHGFNLMYEQEVTPKGTSPYFGLFLQYEYSDREIAIATQQLSGGINIRHPFHRRGDALGWGVGAVEPSDQTLSHEYFSETYYRLQFTQNLQWSFDLQLFIKPSSADQNVAPVFSTRLLFSF